MSLPLKAVERLFDRMAATYGREWIQRWEGLDEKAVKSLWGHELGTWVNRLDAIAWALENLPERCPNAIQFKNLCMKAPAPAEEMLPLPAPNPERMKAELAKLGYMNGRHAHVDRGVDRKGWARAILVRHQSGEKMNPTTLLFANQALGLDRNLPAHSNP